MNEQVFNVVEQVKGRPMILKCIDGIVFLHDTVDCVCYYVTNAFELNANTKAEIDTIKMHYTNCKVVVINPTIQVSAHPRTYAALNEISVPAFE